jgi:heme/copper-type cytochrome/quinol oxidase subunit 1
MAYMATKAQKSLFGHHWMIVATFLSLTLSFIRPPLDDYNVFDSH